MRLTFAYDLIKKTIELEKLMRNDSNMINSSEVENKTAWTAVSSSGSPTHANIHPNKRYVKMSFGVH